MKTQQAHPKKAGIFIHGYHTDDVEKARMAVIAPYSEGRYGADDKYYVLPKGSIDGDESPILAALRETKEETGIDFETFLGPANIAKLMDGQPVENVTHPDFPGVTIRRFDPRPVDHTYKFQGYRPNDVQLYGLEVEGIEHLQPMLKNRENGNGLGRVGTPVAQRVADPKQYPTFKNLAEWMEEGTPPTDSPVRKDVDTELKGVDGQPFREWFAALKEKYHLKDNTPQSWRLFGDPVQRANGLDNAHLREALKQIKSVLDKQGITKGDAGEIKLDEKDSPLSYYQEGADLLYADDYLTFCIERMRANKQYAQCFGGAPQKPGGHLRPRDYIRASQLIACAPFLKPEDIASAEQRVQQGMDTEIPRWDRKPGMAQQKLGLQPLLQEKQEKHEALSERWQEAVARRDEAPLTGKAAPGLG